MFCIYDGFATAVDLAARPTAPPPCGVPLDGVTEFGPFVRSIQWESDRTDRLSVSTPGSHWDSARTIRRVAPLDPTARPSFFPPPMTVDPNGGGRCLRATTARCPRREAPFLRSSDFALRVRTRGYREAVPACCADGGIVFGRVNSRIRSGRRSRKMNKPVAANTTMASPNLPSSPI